MAADADSQLENWGEYELWEKIEFRERRRKRWIIAGAVVVFLVLSAVPVFMDRQPRWRTYRVARGMIQIFSALKTRAAAEGVAYRVSVTPDLVLRLERAPDAALHCSDAESHRWVPVDTTNDVAQREWVESARADGIALLPVETARAQGMDRTTNRFCYDPSILPQGPEPIVQGDGMGLLPQEDLEAGRLDRAVVVTWHDAAAEFSLD